MKGKIKKPWFFSSEEGSVLIIIALFMTVIIIISAFVLDMGIAYYTKSKLQKAMDSSALAAVRELPVTTKTEWENKVVETAKKYAELNNVKSPELLKYNALDKDGKVISINTDNDAKLVNGIQVIGEEKVYNNFARVIGFNFIDITSDASAKLLDIAGMSGLMPFVLKKSDISNIANNSELSLPIKYMQNKAIGDEPGWYGAVEIDGTGANIYENTFINGSKRELFYGDDLFIEEGNMVGPTKDGYLDRIAGHENCKVDVCYNTSEPCSRRVVLPIIEIVYESDISDKTGNDKIHHLEVVGFASVFLNGFEEYDKDGNLVPIADTSLDKLDHKSVLSVSYNETMNIPGAKAVNGTVLNAYNVKAAKLID